MGFDKRKRQYELWKIQQSYEVIIIDKPKAPPICSPRGHNLEPWFSNRICDWESELPTLQILKTSIKTHLHCNSKYFIIFFFTCPSAPPQLELITGNCGSMNIFAPQHLFNRDGTFISIYRKYRYIALDTFIYLYRYIGVRYVDVYRYIPVVTNSHFFIFFPEKKWL